MDNFDHSQIYQNPAVIDKLVRAFNQQHVSKISIKEEKILLQHPDLTQAIFESGIKDLIGSGYVSIEELQHKPILKESLQQKYIANAVMEGALSIGQLEKVDHRKLEELNNSLNAGDTKDRLALGSMLGLGKEKALSFAESMDKLDKTPPHITIIIPLVPIPPASSKEPPVNTI